MRKQGKRWTGALLIAALLACCGCEGQDADRLARLGHKLMAKLHPPPADVRGGPGGPLQSIRGNWNELTLDARVLARLRWEKELEGVNIHVRHVGQGVVELHGTVPELSRRQKAVAVARATVGVNDVVDALSE
jgi:hypothetical protein